MNMYKKGRLILVGAGPGDPELITVKAARVLSNAKIILYDALVNKSLLDYAPEETPRIFVGKRGGMKMCDQNEINELIVRCALQYGEVVRLKGGDPFVFGRGHEEIAYAEQFGIETEVVPGVSSAVSAPASQKIPLTVRGVNESFWIITGTTKNHQLSEDVKVAAKSTATIVILMGMKNLDQIVEIFVANGKKDVPVAIVQNGTLPNEKMVAGTIEEIAALVKENGIGSPAVIVIGEVVRHASNPLIRETFSNFQWAADYQEMYSNAI
jgi:uroporphyrin-III C-methyltransferase